MTKSPKTNCKSLFASHIFYSKLLVEELWGQFNFLETGSYYCNRLSLPISRCSRCCPGRFSGRSPWSDPWRCCPRPCPRRSSPAPPARPCTRGTPPPWRSQPRSSQAGRCCVWSGNLQQGLVTELVKTRIYLVWQLLARYSKIYLILCVR